MAYSLTEIASQAVAKLDDVDFQDLPGDLRPRISEYRSAYHAMPT